MHTPEQRAIALIALLDDERRTGFCDEYGLIANAFRMSDAFWREEMRAQIATREQEIAMLKQVYQIDRNRKHVSDAEQQQIREAVASGLSYREVARRFGLKSPSSVHKFVRDLPKSETQ